MDQAEAAARALDSEAEDVHMMRALETAIAVSYARIFTQSSLLRLDADEYAPADGSLVPLHRMLRDLRDRVYAHTDKNSGRDAAMEITAATGLGGSELYGIQPAFGLQARESWLPFPREAIPDALSLFDAQRERFRREAAEIQIRLDFGS